MERVINITKAINSKHTIVINRCLNSIMKQIRAREYIYIVREINI